MEFSAKYGIRLKVINGYAIPYSYDTDDVDMLLEAMGNTADAIRNGLTLEDIERIAYYKIMTQCMSESKWVFYPIPKPPKGECVYFVEAIIGGVPCIKIGYSGQVKKRMTGLFWNLKAQGDEIGRLLTCAMHKDARLFEAELHKLHDAHRVDGEYFAYQPIIDWLQQVKKANDKRDAPHE